FIFIADQHASLKADHILDYHAGEDLIRLISGERSITKENIHFDESSQTLSYHSEDANGHSHTHHIRIDSHNSLKLLEDDVLQNLHIL
ncbi:MAG: hypothetical protein Q4D61_09245, partial [Cardiobacteriaceae bacterium]|nr:hypothetical protein [Cardiobacteriaceae bacterium]